MTPEEIEIILKSNAKAIASNSTAIAESRRETKAIYDICKELASDRAVMFEILKGFNEERVLIHESLASLAENVASLSANVAKLTENQ